MKTTSPVPTELEDLALHAAGELAQSMSLNRIVGQLYALLYIRPEPVSLEEMSRRLQVSKGSASINIRVLEEWNAVHRVLVPGSRKDFYRAETDFLKIITERAQKGFAKRLSLLDDRLKHIQKELQSRESRLDKKQAAFYQDRIKKIHELKTLAEKVLVRLPQMRLLAKML